MREQRWPWLWAASLMLTAAAATAWATYLHWRPCRGSMFNGTMFRGYDYGAGFTDACSRRMDTSIPFPYPPEPAEQTPWASELGVAAILLAALAWLVLVLGLRWSLKTKAVAALPGLASLVVVALAAVALSNAARSPEDYLSLRLWLTIDLAVVVAAVGIVIWQPEVRGLRLLRLLLVLWGTTAFGFLHGVAEYTTMGIHSDANWDIPPGTGYLTGAVLLSAAILTVMVTLLLSQSGSAVEVPGPSTQRVDSRSDASATTPAP